MSATQDQGALAANITLFARALRAAGLPVGPDHMLNATRALEAVGVQNRSDVRYALVACFVSRPEHRDVFARVFDAFWRERWGSLAAPNQETALDNLAEVAQAPQAVGDHEGFLPQTDSSDTNASEQLDPVAAASVLERFRTRDFERMSDEERAAARRALARLDLKFDPIRSRRLRSDPVGKLADWRATLRQSVRSGGELRTLVRRSHGRRPPNLVVLCDISGSMSVYSRMLLHFLHSLMHRRGADWAQVYGFVFGTQLTDITRHLRLRSPDAALDTIGQMARDWSGGTRIGACLRIFNRDWSRRLLGQGGVVLLVTDGLERDDPELLATEAERLHLSARRLIWLNPLLRWDGFVPRARGIQALLPHVDDFHACHSLESLEQLGEMLKEPHARFSVSGRSTRHSHKPAAKRQRSF
ncbi:MAG: VWA domain-containing protein [Pseudomonadota bacterium]